VSKKRVSTSKSAASAGALSSLKRHAFVGLALAGGKSDKTCLASVEYYPKQRKIFLSQLHDRIRSEGDISSDLILVEELNNRDVAPEFVAYNVPLNLPKCMRCKLKCPGYESCSEDEIVWMWDNYRRLELKRAERKIFTPYTERCVEQYLSSSLEEPFHVQHALGANLAPLTARAAYLHKRMKYPSIEVFPKLSLWRIGRALNIQKSHLRHHKHQEGGQESRMVILKELIRQDVAFIYEQDVRLMVESVNAFDAFICALTAVLKFTGQVERPPKGFPLEDGWIEIPKESIVW
jgi:hypothetical protein